MMVICFKASLTQLEYLTNVPINVHYTRSQWNSCHTASMMGLCGKHSYLGTLAKHLSGHWDHIPTSHELGHLIYQIIPSTNKSLACLSGIHQLREWSNKVQLDNNTNNGNSFGFIIFTDHEWETDKCSILVQVHCSHDMVSKHKGKMLVNSINCGNTALYYFTYILHISIHNCAYVNKPLDSLPHLLKCVTSHWPHICLSSTDFKATWQASWCNHQLGHSCQGCVPKGHKLTADNSCNTHPFQFIIFCHPITQFQ